MWSAISHLIASLHDRCGISSEHTEDLYFSIACENTEDYDENDFGIRIDRMKLLPDHMHEVMGSFF